MVGLVTDELIMTGSSIVLKNGLTIKHPTVGDVLTMGASTYASTISMFMTRPYDFAIQLYDAGDDYQKYTNMDMFITLYLAHGVEACKFFWGEHEFIPKNRHTENGIKAVLYEESTKIIFDDDDLAEVDLFLTKINNIKPDPMRDLRFNFDTSIGKETLDALIDSYRHKSKSR